MDTNDAATTTTILQRIGTSWRKARENEASAILLSNHVQVGLWTVTLVSPLSPSCSSSRASSGDARSPSLRDGGVVCVSTLRQPPLFFGVLLVLWLVLNLIDARNREIFGRREFFGQGARARGDQATRRIYAGTPSARFSPRDSMHGLWSWLQAPAGGSHQ